ncbi:hypothetical protein N1851_019612 [Merluccius polli]|uniref:C2H2-type domain-containing protein n=1 Tax=Merluccius polli TaxID=89951 RepID=A0AA47NZ17_MERPO|nr:hypothetical protein N1851_019612 [Merluccius polli]
MQCKFCSFSADQDDLVRHHQLCHKRRHHWPCVYSDCDFLKHLGNHLKIQETIQCPFLGCEFKTNTYSTFSSHKSRKHKQYTVKDFRTVIQPISAEAGIADESVASTLFQDDSSFVFEEDRVAHLDFEQVEHKVACLFLSMQTVLHVTRSAIQKIVEEIRDIFICSKCLAFRSVAEVLENNISTENNLLQDIVDSVFTSNPFVTKSVKGCLSTDYRRTCYFKKKFSLIEPVEYLYRQGSTNTFIYVPLPLVLESLLRCPDFLGALVFRQEHLAGIYRSFQNGQYFRQSRGNTEGVANPLGTSRNIHKIVAVYWLILNLSATFRGGLTVIQLGALGNSHDVKEFGYAEVLENNISTENNLLQDIVDSVFTSNPFVTKSVKGCLSTDYRRTCYFKKTFSLIEPVEYLYRQGSTNTFIYVPLPLVLESLLRCPDFLGALVFRQEHLAGIYRSFQNGQYFRQSRGNTEGVEISIAL